ncbi:hypothetical protein ACP70R_026955 [Stipagrostis hirtigluma subsp. patula]
MTLETTMHDEIDLEAGHSPAPPPATATSSKKNKKRSGCCRRLACCALFTVAAVAVVVGALAAAYLALDPKLPRYTVTALNVTAFGMDDDLTARARFDAAVRFENPNRAIGIRYDLRGGFAPRRGPHGDAAEVRVAMSEARLRGTGVVEAMRHVNGAGGELPLVFRGEVPVRVKVGAVTTAKVTPSVRCDLVLDRLATEGAIGVKNMTCNFSIKLW